MTQFTYLPDIRWLIGGGLLIAAVLFLSYFTARRRSNRWLRTALAALRWFAIAGVFLCLFDPEWVDTIKHQQKARLAVLLDTSRSMSIKDVPQERLVEGKNWLQQKFASQVPDNVAVQYFTFNQVLGPLASFDAANPGGEATALADSLEAVLNLPNDDPLAGVILVSDGIESGRRDPVAAARYFRRKGVPIHTFTTGTTNEMQDIVVENVQVKRAVPNQSPTRITLTVRAPGYAGKTVPVEIRQRNQLVATEARTLNGGAQKIEMDFTPGQKGFQVYEVRVPPQRGEWLTTNNRRVFGLEVIDPTIRVIYMEGTPQQPNSPIPEWKYLKAALEADPNIKVKTLYRQFSSNGQALNVVDTDPETGQRIYPVEHATQGFPRTLTELLKYDVVIHSDIRKESFTSEQLQNIAALVQEHGGGFVMIGGNSAFGKGGYHRTILDRIIPVAMEQGNDSVAQTFRPLVPVSVLTHPIVSIGATRQETTPIWAQRFPALYGCNLVERAKPGATVLALAPISRSPTGQSVLLAVQNIGKGRSMAFTSDTTRTWGRDFETLWGEPISAALPLNESNCDSRYYRQFWINAIRWLAAGRMGRTNDAVSLELAQSYCAPNDRVRASVKVRTKNQSEINNADVAVSVSVSERSNIVMKARFDPVSRCYVADIVPFAAGTFTVAASATLNRETLGSDQQLLVAEAVDNEMADVRARPEVMANIARASGGNVLHTSTSDDDGGFAAVFRNAPPVRMEYCRTPLWDRWWLLAAILGLLGVEWTLRRVNGMA
jgi:uncharacterized membrane protein